MDGIMKLQQKIKTDAGQRGAIEAAEKAGVKEKDDGAAA
jgi:hypothetical protein